MDAMALEGDIATFPLRDLFAWLVERRASGVLSLTRGMTARRFHLRAGQVRLVSSSEQDMLLGQLLVESKLVGPDALAQAIAARGRSRARLGRLLARGGLVTPRQLQAILTEKVRRLLADALTWSDGCFFYQAAAPDADAAEEQRRARREDSRAIPVMVDLEALLQQIHEGVAVADDDVIEACPALTAPE